MGGVVFVLPASIGVDRSLLRWPSVTIRHTPDDAAVVVTGRFVTHSSRLYLQCFAPPAI